jgi:hypothetical protein
MGQALFGGNGKKPQVLKEEESNKKKKSRNYRRIPVSF